MELWLLFSDSGDTFVSTFPRRFKTAMLALKTIRGVNDRRLSQNQVRVRIPSSGVTTTGESSGKYKRELGNKKTSATGVTR